MATGLQVWSQTAATNASADSNINWAEGQAPSSVNDSARAGMASMAKWRDDNSGTIVTGGTSLAFTAATAQVEGALTAGYTIAVQFHATADASATLAVDSLTAKPITLASTAGLMGQEIQAGTIQRLTYTTSGSGQWQLQDYTKPTIPGFALSAVTSTSTGSFTLSSSSVFTDTVFVTQGTTGVWFASGTITAFNVGSTDYILAKLWDGTTVIGSAESRVPGTGQYMAISLSGVITNPVANIKISCTSNNGSVIVTTGNIAATKDSNLTAIRIG